MSSHYSRNTLQRQLEELSRRAEGQTLGLVLCIQDRLVTTSGADLQEIADQVGLTITTLNEAADGTGDVDDAAECVSCLLEAMGERDPNGVVKFWLRRARRRSDLQLCA